MKSKRPVTITGRQASSTDPATWADRKSAVRSMAGIGAGFVLNGDGIVCLDLDHCLVDGRPDVAATRLLAQVPATFIEVSPSGDGLHVWGFGSLPTGWKRRVAGVNVEAYGNGRYMTVTGHRFDRAPSVLTDLTEVLEAIT